MADLLQAARNRAHAVRFAGEKVGVNSAAVERRDQTIQKPLRKALDVTPEVTPYLHKVVAAVCRNLSVPLQSVRARVYASEEMQAQCSLADNGCLIEISSSLVEHLDSDEQAFVFGHELGHFLLDHHFLDLPPGQSLEGFRLVRAREISADRLGLIAAGNAEAAMRAVMKTFSGLTERHLRFDAASFLRHSFDIENASEIAASQWDTHPSFAVRARCLVHFMPLVGMALDNRWLNEFQTIDLRVLKDIEKFSEGVIQERLNDLLERCKEWIWMFAAVATGKISTSSMSILEADLDSDFVKKVRLNFSQMTAAEVDTLIESNLETAVSGMLGSGSADVTKVFADLCTESESKFHLAPGSNNARPIYARRFQANPA